MTVEKENEMKKEFDDLKKLIDADVKGKNCRAKGEAYCRSHKPASNMTQECAAIAADCPPKAGQQKPRDIKKGCKPHTENCNMCPRWRGPRIVT